MTSNIVHEQNLEKQIEKQMGCMSGFLQLFDRNQYISGKKFNTTKRITSATGKDSSSEPVKSAAVSPSPNVVTKTVATPSPEPRKQSPKAEVKSHGSTFETPKAAPLPLPLFDMNERTKSTWKLKEVGRLSLDSRATYDAAKGSLHRKEIRKDRVILSESTAGEGDDGDDKQRPRSSTSVIAKLMGLEPLSQPDCDPGKPNELRRSASESRVSRELFHYRFVEGNNKQQNQSHSSNVSNHQMERSIVNDKSQVRQSKASSNTWRSLFEAAEIFPEPVKKAENVAIEKRLKMRGIDEASRDLETLKQILEAWQLKGLLHSKRPSELVNHRNVVYDRSFTSVESQIVVMRPSKSPIRRRIDNDSSPLRRRNLNLAGESVSPRRERNVRSPIRARSSSDGNVMRSNSIVKPKPLRVETQRRVNESTESRRANSASIHSPKVSPRRNGSDRTATNGSPRKGRKPTTEIDRNENNKITTVVTEDEASSISESTVSTSSQTERSKMEEYKEGRSLLERCDKLLHSIAEMGGTDQQQSSPVSVLDSSFYESQSPSPIMKRTIDFKDNSGEDEEAIWIHVISQPNFDNMPDDCDLIYISEILRASNYLPEDSDIFSLLEKQQVLKGENTSKVSRLKRKLIFDTIAEIIERNKQLPPWNNPITAKPTLHKIWSEFQKIRERESERDSSAEDLVDIICGVLKKDLASDAINGWGECPAVEQSEVVLEIERMIFRDIVGESIRDLAAYACESSTICRKLVF